MPIVPKNYPHPKNGVKNLVWLEYKAVCRNPDATCQLNELHNPIKERRNGKKSILSTPKWKDELFKVSIGPMTQLVSRIFSSSSIKSLPLKSIKTFPIPSAGFSFRGNDSES